MQKRIKNLVSFFPVTNIKLFNCSLVFFYNYNSAVFFCWFSIDKFIVIDQSIITQN